MTSMVVHDPDSPAQVERQEVDAWTFSHDWHPLVGLLLLLPRGYAWTHEERDQWVKVFTTVLDIMWTPYESLAADNPLKVADPFVDNNFASDRPTVAEEPSNQLERVDPDMVGEVYSDFLVVNGPEPTEKPKTAIPSGYKPCPRCGSKMWTGASLCKDCHEKERAEKRAAVEGLACPDCGGPKGMYSKRCAKCHAKAGRPQDHSATAERRAQLGIARAVGEESRPQTDEQKAVAEATTVVTEGPRNMRIVLSGRCPNCAKEIVVEGAGDDRRQRCLKCGWTAYYFPAATA